MAAATASASGPGRSSWASERSTPVHEGSMPTIGTPSRAAAARDATVRPRIRFAASSWPVVIQVRPQHSSVVGQPYGA